MKFQTRAFLNAFPPQMRGDARHGVWHDQGRDIPSPATSASPAPSIESLAEQFGTEAPAALRAMADDLERILASAGDSVVTQEGDVSGDPDVMH